MNQSNNIDSPPGNSLVPYDGGGPPDNTSSGGTDSPPGDSIVPYDGGGTSAERGKSLDFPPFEEETIYARVDSGREATNYRELAENGEFKELLGEIDEVLRVFENNQELYENAGIFEKMKDFFINEKTDRGVVTLRKAKEEIISIQAMYLHAKRIAEEAGDQEELKTLRDRRDINLFPTFKSLTKNAYVSVTKERVKIGDDGEIEYEDDGKKKKKKVLKIGEDGIEEVEEEDTGKKKVPKMHRHVSLKTLSEGIPEGNPFDTEETEEEVASAERNREKIGKLREQIKVYRREMENESNKGKPDLLIINFYQGKINETIELIRKYERMSKIGVIFSEVYDGVTDWMQGKAKSTKDKASDFADKVDPRT